MKKRGIKALATSTGRQEKKARFVTPFLKEQPLNNFSVDLYILGFTGQSEVDRLKEM